MYMYVEGKNGLIKAQQVKLKLQKLGQVLLFCNGPNYIYEGVDRLDTPYCEFLCSSGRLQRNTWRVTRCGLLIHLVPVRFCDGALGEFSVPVYGPSSLK